MAAVATIHLVFVASAAACITHLGTVPLQDDKEKTSTEKNLPDSEGVQEDKQFFDDCGYQEIVVDNPDKTKTIIIVPLECVDEPVDTVCDPSIENPVKSHEIDVSQNVNR